MMVILLVYFFYLGKVIFLNLLYIIYLILCVLYFFHFELGVF